MTNFSLNTPHLTLLCCTPEMLTAAMTHEKRLSEQLAVSIAENWASFGVDIFAYSLEKIQTTPADAKWWSYFPIHKTDTTLIGTCGFKGAVDAKGCVEIGYEIAPAYRNKGLATECAQALIQFAFQHAEITCIQAHTLAAHNPSTQVLQKCGFTKVETLIDPDEGELWRWELFR